MKVVTWNVNSLRAREERVLRWIERHRPDVICLQELKLEEEKFPSLAIRELGYQAAVLGQKTYNGVAILGRGALSDVHAGLEDDVDDPQARLISARIGDVHVISAYFPNGGEMGSDKLQYKLAWMKRLRAYLDRRFDPETDRVALCGDFNVAVFDDDVARLDEWGGGVLTCDAVREGLEEVRAFGLRDVFRPFHPDGGVYTWWDYRGRGFERGNGLRIDHVFATEALARRCVGAIVDREERSGEGPSDHAPVLVEFG